jgi:hypothetical protein
MDDSMFAPCGLDCGECSIWMIPINAALAQEAIDWFKKMGWLKDNEGRKVAIKKKMYCNGCRGDRFDAHWSPDCSILKCCVDEKHYKFCYECEEFVCIKLVEWRKNGNHHEKAFQ